MNFNLCRKKSSMNFLACSATPKYTAKTITCTEDREKNINQILKETWITSNAIRTLKGGNRTILR